MKQAMEEANASPSPDANAAAEYAVWPPSKHMRDRLVERIATNLTAMSFFDEKVGRLDLLSFDGASSDRCIPWGMLASLIRRPKKRST